MQKTMQQHNAMMHLIAKNVLMQKIMQQHNDIIHTQQTLPEYRIQTLIVPVINQATKREYRDVKMQDSCYYYKVKDRLKME